MTENNEGAQDTPEALAAQKVEADAAAAKAAADAAAKAKEDSTKGSEGARIVPEAYKLTPPKDSLLKPEAVQKLAEFAKEHKLTQDEAQAVLERENTVLSSYVEAQKAEVEAVTKQWIEEVKADKELGGENFAKTAELSRRAIEKFAPELKEELEKTGLGNHPGFVRFAYRIGKAMDGDSWVKGGPGTGARKSNAEVFYPEVQGQQ